MHTLSKIIMCIFCWCFLTNPISANVNSSSYNKHITHRRWIKQHSHGVVVVNNTESHEYHDNNTNICLRFQAF